MTKWANGKSLAQTQTYERSDDQEQFPAYLYDIAHKNGEWLLTLWNETPSTDNKVASVKASGSVGDARVYENSIEKGSIPGFATYFWFLPQEGVFANLRFQHAASGHSALRSYLKGYLERSSDFVRYDQSKRKEGSDVKITGYAEQNHSEVRDLAPRFSSSVYTKPGQTDMLLNRFADVRRVIHKVTLHLKNTDDLAFWQSAWRRLKGSDRTAQGDDVTVEYDIKTQLTRAEMSSIISTADIDKASWDDVGFELKGEPSPFWLSKSYAREKLDLDVVRQNIEIVDSASLLDELQRRKVHLLKLLSNESRR